MLNARPIPAFSDNYFWLLSADSSPRCAVVDPGLAEPVLRALSDHRGELEAILVTHHHADHVGGIENLVARFPKAVVYGPNEPRYASLRGIKQARAKPVEKLSHVDLGLSDDDVGEAGSASRVRRMYMPEKGQAELIEGTPAEQAARIAEIIKELQGDT